MLTRNSTCRIALAPAFAGIRHFPEGRSFKQWMGDDSKALMKVNHIYYYYNLWFLYCGTGVFIRHWGSCPRRDGIGHAGLYWLLLHRKMGYPQHAQSWNTQSCPWTLSSAPEYFWRVRHLNKGFQSTTSTFNDPLHSIDSHVWCPKQALFFDHRIQTHQSRERALETVQLLECFGADANHQFATW